MTARILDGKALALAIQDELAEEVADFIENNAFVPTLAAVLVGDDPASDVYVRNKRKACERIGIESVLHRLPAETTEEPLLSLIARLNKDQAIHGILIQLPLPAGIAEHRVLLAVSPNKDVDAFHPENVGRLVQAGPVSFPARRTESSSFAVRSGIETAGRHAVVVGRSDIVGKPMAILLSARGPGGDATVTICHSRTQNLVEHTRRADILVVASGRPKMIAAEMVKPGATVIDVGIHRTAEGLVGDVDFVAVREVAGAITPVPGGVGPLTVTMLLANTLAAARELAT